MRAGPDACVGGLCHAPRTATNTPECASSADGYLAIAVQEGGLSPHPEVFTLEADGVSTAVVLAQAPGAREDGVGIPERALHNVTADQVRETLRVGVVPDEAGWNVTLAYRGTVTRAELAEVCDRLREAGSQLADRYPAEECHDGTTLTLRLWTPDGLIVSTAECEAAKGTTFDEVRWSLRNATLTARERANAPG